RFWSGHDAPAYGHPRNGRPAGTPESSRGFPTPGYDGPPCTRRVRYRARRARVTSRPPLRCTVDGIDGRRESVEACLEAVGPAAAILVADVEPTALAKHPIQFGRHAVVGMAAVGIAVGDRGPPLAGVVDPDDDSRRQEATERYRHQQQRILAAEGIAGGDLEQHFAAVPEGQRLADVASPCE